MNSDVGFKFRLFQNIMGKIIRLQIVRAGKLCEVETKAYLIIQESLSLVKPIPVGFLNSSIMSPLRD